MRVLALLALAGATILPTAASAQEVLLVNGIGGTVTWSIDGGPLIATPARKSATAAVTPGSHKLTMNAPPARGQSYSVGLTMDEEFKAEDLVAQGDRKFWCVTAVVFMNLPMVMQADPEECRKMTKGFAPE